MNLKSRLQSEHSKSLTHAIVAYVDTNELRLKELMVLFFGEDKRVAQRAAWPVGFIFIKHPQLLKKYYGELIKKLQTKDKHPALTRNILRVLQEVEIPEKFQGDLVDVCFALIRNETQPAAIRAFAITTAANICKPYPELKNELLLLFKELQQVPQKPAVRVRVKAAVKYLG